VSDVAGVDSPFVENVLLSWQVLATILRAVDVRERNPKLCRSIRCNPPACSFRLSPSRSPRLFRRHVPLPSSPAHALVDSRIFLFHPGPTRCGSSRFYRVSYRTSYPLSNHRYTYPNALTKDTHFETEKEKSSISLPQDDREKNRPAKLT
jgi:hypothetical protein